MSAPLLLALETSCDETSAAVLRGEDELLGHVIFTQDIHRHEGSAGKVQVAALLEELDVSLSQFTGLHGRLRSVEWGLL